MRDIIHCMHQLQRQHDREEYRKQRSAKEKKADRKQRSAKEKKKKGGGGVRESIMEKGEKIARNKEKWANMCRDRKPQKKEQEGTPDEDETNKWQGGQ
jgi:hypothetical protein